MSAPSSRMRSLGRHLGRRPAALVLATVLGLGVLAGAGGAVLGGVGAATGSEFHQEHHGTAPPEGPDR